METLEKPPATLRQEQELELDRHARLLSAAKLTGTGTGTARFGYKRSLLFRAKPISLVSVKPKSKAGDLEAKPCYEYDKDYVEKNLIAYIGNKRRLLPLLSKALASIESQIKFKKKPGDAFERSHTFFVDYFAGTGIVARFARSLGYKVIANDWEPYAYTINKAFLEDGDERTFLLFDDEGGFAAVIKKLNSLKHVEPEHAYISKYYAPKNTATADPNKERLFYTTENALRIDAIRANIDKRYPPLSDSLKIQKKRKILLALLLLESSKRSNTSGVFKAFHHGFGGRKKDALTRILKPLQLAQPHFPKAKAAIPAKVYKYNALSLATKLPKQLKGSVVIAYLDPPYNQHQYGSNYHLLNSILLNDKPPIRKSFFIDGKKKDKSGIRKDWVKTRSGFCYKRTALTEFRGLVESMKADYIMLSYSSEGVLSFDELLTIMARQGKPSIVATDYTRYRGARQTNITRTRNLEFVLMADCNQVASKEDIEEVRAEILLNKLKGIFKPSCFYPLSESWQDQKKQKISGNSMLEYSTLPCPPKQAVASGISIVFKNFFDAGEEGTGSLFTGIGISSSSSPSPESCKNHSLLKAHAHAHANDDGDGKDQLTENAEQSIVIELDSQLGLKQKSLFVLKALSFQQQRRIFEALLKEQPCSNEERIVRLIGILEKFHQTLDVNFFLLEILRLFKKLQPKKDAEARKRCQETLRSFLSKFSANIPAQTYSKKQKKEIIQGFIPAKQATVATKIFVRRLEELTKAVA